MAIERADPNSSPARDRFEACLLASGAEDLRRCLKKKLTIANRIRAQFAVCLWRFSSHLFSG
jgi:hypothetical protein